jgi:hypothetical protein
MSLVSDGDMVKPKKPRKTTKPTAPPAEQQIVVEKTNYSPPVEGFTGTPRNFPIYAGPSIFFKRGTMDSFYDEYKRTNLLPNPQLVSMVQSMAVPPPDLPNYGALLSSFDAGSISSIPWDADNATSLQRDIVWGIVTPDASKSIFMKTYHQNLMSDPENMEAAEAEIFYHSALFGVNATSPGDALLLQVGEAVGAVTGQMALSAASSKMDDLWKVAAGNQMIARFEKAKAARIASLTKEGKLLSAIDDPVLKSLDNQIKDVADAKTRYVKLQDEAIKAKETLKQALTPDEKLIKASAAADDAKKGGAVAADGVKQTKSLNVMAKFKAGAAKTKELLKGLKAAFLRMFTKALEAFSKRFATSRAIIWSTLALMNAALTAATVATFGAMAPFLAVVAAMSTAYGVLDAVCQVLTLVLMILLPTLLDKALANGGVCGDGKPIDQIISDDFLYFMFTTFCPIGGLLDVFGPYICYKSDGTPTMKQPLYIPAYFVDTTLSLNKHNYTGAEEPRGDSTRYVSNVPAGWTITAGIARKPCAPGTWTSSDVDMLCNISSYVPRTYPKLSNVPATVVKGSKVPATIVKKTYVSTFVNSQPRIVKTPRYSGCPNGWRDTDIVRKQIGDCWEDAKCTTNCSGNWDPSTWRCDTNCSGCGCVKLWSWERENCDFGDGVAYTKYLSLCRSKCPAGTSTLTEIDLLCKTSCGQDETDWVVLPFCSGNTDAWCERNAATRGPGGTNWRHVAGVCWQGCPAGYTDVGALCRAGCAPGQKEVLGVCWDSCPAGTSDQGALCRYQCGGSTPRDVAGVCWGDCGNDIDVGALCRERCRPGFHEVAGVCWGDIGTYARESMIPKSIKIYDSGYNPPRNLSDVRFPYCDFSKEEMLDRMAQFYYDQSTLNPEMLQDGRISYEYIIQFYGLIASSELSCDVACQIKTVKFDPITGDHYEETVGTTYPGDPGNEVSYRRFYFINIDAESARLLAENAATNPSLYKKAWPADPQGMFTVTGCTNSDYTAPNAQVRSTDPGVDPPMSLPKTFAVTDKQSGAGPRFDKATFAASFATTAISTAVGYRPSRSKGFKQVDSMSGQIIGNVGGTIAGEASVAAINKAMNAQVPLGAAAESNVVGPISGSIADGTAVFNIVTNNDNYSINHGPIYEVRARDSTGYVPRINFCGKVNTTELLCSDEKILRDTIDTYHRLNPSIHIKSVSLIEPRGKDGCYYNVGTVSYDAATNTEGTVSTAGEFVRKYIQDDDSTCVFTPTDTFISDLKDYPIRSYYDPVLKETVYPTRNKKSTSTIAARYVRVRPSQTGDGYLRISQIAVYDSTGVNLALNRPVYSSAPTYSGASPPNAIVDGTLAPRSWPGVWAGGADKQRYYIDIDLGQGYLINHVLFFGQLDIAVPANDQGLRIELLASNEATATPLKQLVLGTSNRLEKVDFSTTMVLPKLPIKPFKVPRPLPAETNLGSDCANRCQDKNQIDAMLLKYNTENNMSQIMKITKAFTPSPNRCDYEVEMVRVVGTDKTVAKEMLSMTAAVASRSTTSTSVYGRVVRIVDAPFTTGTVSAPLMISQVAIMNTKGENIALGKKTYATINNIKSMNPSKYGISSLITDGQLKERPSPNYWSGDNYADMSIEVDLGINREISSITIYGVAGNNYQGVTVQILGSVEKNAVPVYTTTLQSGKTQFTLSNFPTCAFTYTPLTSPYTFIQDTTPVLSSIDTSGGVLFFKGITDSIVGLYNTVVQNISTVNPLKVLKEDIKAANTTVTNIVASAAANLQLNGCPNTKCSDPAILHSIANTYNANNSPISTQYGRETNVMTQISKAGVSGPNTCDVLFTNIYSFYDDFLYPPTTSQNTTMIKRFTMNNMGNCALRVAPGSITIDLSSNAVGILPASSVVTPPFNIKACEVNCRDPAILASVKAKANSMVSADSSIPNFTTVLQSFANGPNTCEYSMRKDVTRTNLTTKKTTTAKGIQTYITANFTTDPTNCRFTLSTVNELDPELVTTKMDPITGIQTAYVKGLVVDPPYLFNYDNTTPSTQVNETPLII